MGRELSRASRSISDKRGTVPGRTRGGRSFAVARSNTGLLAPCDGPARCRTPLTLMPRSVPREDLCPCSATGTAWSSGHQTRQIVLLNQHCTSGQVNRQAPWPAVLRPGPGTSHAGRVMRHKKKTGEGRGWSAKFNGGVKPYPNVFGWHDTERPPIADGVARHGGQMGWRSNRRAVIAAAACALVAVACGRSAPVPGHASPVKGLVTVTPAGTKTVPSVVWRTYRNVDSLDPAFSIDFPEYTAVSLMCESLLRQAPDGALQPGLATVANPNPTTMVFTLRPGVKFWDGHPVTPADVVYSLNRNTDPQLGGFYRAVFNRVASITATGPAQVTIRLKQPDYWLEGELSSMPGVIIEKSFAQKEGKNYGTPAGSIMCTGAYKLQFWT